jgi:hypothetical protein
LPVNSPSALQEDTRERTERTARLPMRIINIFLLLPQMEYVLNMNIPIGMYVIGTTKI